MNAGPTVPLGRLPVLLTGPRAPVWWAMLLLVTIEAMVFGTLLSAYLYLRFGAAAWPPDGVAAPDLLLPAVNTVMLAASAAAVFLAARALEREDTGRFPAWLGAAVALMAAVLAVKGWELAGLEFRWDRHAYGSIYWMVNCFHAAHVTAAVLLGAGAWVLAVRGYFAEGRRVGMQAVAIYWYFVAAAWVPVFAVLYLVPRWF